MNEEDKNQNPPTEAEEKSWQYWAKKNEEVLQEVIVIALVQLQDIIAISRQFRTPEQEGYICILCSAIDLSGYKIRKMPPILNADSGLRILPTESKLNLKISKPKSSESEKTPVFANLIMASEEKCNRFKRHYDVLSDIKEFLEMENKTSDDFEGLQVQIEHFHMHLISLNKLDENGKRYPVFY